MLFYQLLGTLFEIFSYKCNVNILLINNILPPFSIKKIWEFTNFNVFLIKIFKQKYNVNIIVYYYFLRSNIPIGNKKCLAISLTHPTHKKSKLTDANLIPKKREYKIAVDELLIYIDRYERKFCKKFVYYEPGTPYKGEVTKPGRKKRNRVKYLYF